MFQLNAHTLVNPNASFKTSNKSLIKKAQSQQRFYRTYSIYRMVQDCQSTQLQKNSLNTCSLFQTVWTRLQLAVRSITGRLLPRQDVFCQLLPLLLGNDGLQIVRKLSVTFFKTFYSALLGVCGMCVCAETLELIKGLRVSVSYSVGQRILYD